MNTIMILNGPNLNLLGTRETNIYGKQSLKDLEAMLKKRFSTMSFDFFQSNSESDIIGCLQEMINKNYLGLVANFAAYSHTSIAIRDAVCCLSCPKVEVHISNIYARETFRHHSITATVMDGMICGFGLKGYIMAVQEIMETIKT